MRSADSWAAWIAEKLYRWVNGVQILAAIAKYVLQTAYAAGLASSLQGEWQYLCCTTPGVANSLASVEVAI